MPTLLLTCLFGSLALLQGSGQTTMPASVVRVEEGRIVVKNKGKDHSLLIGPGLKVLDGKGQELAAPDLKSLLKPGDGLTVRTTRAKPEDFPNLKLEANAKMVTQIWLASNIPSSGDQRDNPDRRRTRDGKGSAGTVAAAEVVKVEKGKLTAKVDGEEKTFGFSVRVKALDLEGKEPKLPAQLLVPGNVLALKTTTPDPAEVRAGRFANGELVITEMRLVKGRLGSMESAASTSREPPEVKRPANMLSEALTPKQWDAYYQSAKVGDFIEFRSRGDKDDRPSRCEVMEVGEKFVVVLTTSYYLGQPEYTWRKRELREVAGPGPRLPGSGSGRKSEVELSVDGRKLKCELVETGDRKNPDSRKWSCKQVPFDGLVRHEVGGGKVIYELLRFRRGD